MTTMPTQSIIEDHKISPQVTRHARVLRFETDPDRDGEDDGSFNDDDLDGNDLNDEDDEFRNHDLDDGLGGPLDDDHDQFANDELVPETKPD